MMKRSLRSALIAAAAALVSASAGQAATLDRIETGPWDAPDADVATLTRAAQTCIAQTVKPGFIDAPTIVSSDPVGGVIVANNSFAPPGFKSARSTLTFEAKPGRFRIVHTGLEAFLGHSWWPAVTPWRDSFTKSVTAISDSLAACVVAGVKSSAW